MIISRTPLRISFAGGGSDLPSYYRYDTGAVVATAIDKYIYITVNPKFDRRIRASYSITEIVDHVDELKHELIREALKLLNIDGGIEITSISDIPDGTGLGSSSTYTVGLLKALHAYKGEHVGAERLACEACEIEITRCGKPVGKQDQYIGAYGGFQYMQFNGDESVFVDPIICAPLLKTQLQERLLLLYMGTTRSANAILREQQSNTGPAGAGRGGVQRMVRLAGELRDSLSCNNLDSFGEVLNAGWAEKKKLASSISNSQIDEWHDIALQHGALGGKVLGAGGGGFLLFYARPECHDPIKRALPELRQVPFRFEPQGSKIIYVEAEQ